MSLVCTPFWGTSTSSKSQMQSVVFNVNRTADFISSWLKACKHHKQVSQQWGGGGKSKASESGRVALCEHVTACVSSESMIYSSKNNIRAVVLIFFIESPASLTGLHLSICSGTGVLIQWLRRWPARCRTGPSSSGSTRRAAGLRDAQEAGEGVNRQHWYELVYKKEYNLKTCSTVDVSLIGFVLYKVG